MFSHLQDYYATIYSAEIVNTLTNVFFMSLGVRGIKNCLGNGHDTIFLISFIGFTLVGAGKKLFDLIYIWVWLVGWETCLLRKLLKYF